MPDLLHLTTTGAWNDAQGSGVYPIPGGAPFIHLCHPDQLEGVSSASSRDPRATSSC